MFLIYELSNSNIRDLNPFVIFFDWNYITENNDKSFANDYANDHRLTSLNCTPIAMAVERARKRANRSTLGTCERCASHIAIACAIERKRARLVKSRKMHVAE